MRVGVDLKQWVAKNWDVVVDAAVSRLREVLTVEELEKLMAPKGRDAAEKRKGRLEALRDRLNDDKVAREVVAPVLLLMQAEKLGVNEETLKYFAAVISGAIDGDGSVSAAYSIRAKVRDAGSALQVIVSGGDAARLAGLYFLYGPLLLEWDERVINHKLAEAVRLGAEGLDIRWEGLRRAEGGLVAADLILLEGGAAVKYNVYLSEKAIVFEFESTDRSRVELAARLWQVLTQR